MDFFEFIFTIVVGAFAALIIFSHQKLDIEEGKKPLYTSTNGGQIGIVHYKGPFISLRIYDEFVVLGYGKKVVLHYDEIISIEIKQWRGFALNQIQINHSNPNVPKTIIIGTTNAAEAKALIDVRLTKQGTS